MAPPTVVLVRLWTDAHAGGCCSGDVSDARERGSDAQVLTATYRALRKRLPDVDVQVVSTSNVGYLLPTAFRAARRDRGIVAALGRAVDATRPGTVLFNGRAVGDLLTLGPEGVLDAVRRAMHPVDPR